MNVPGALPLAPLAFGEATATAFDSVSTCGAFIAKLPGAPSMFDAIGPEQAFRTRFRTVVLPTLTLLAGTSTPKAVDHCSERIALVIPFGQCGSVVRSTEGEHRWASPHHGYFIPAGLRVEAESTAGSFLRLDIPPALLERVAEGMTGVEPQRKHSAGVLDLDRACMVPLQANGSNWSAIIRALCSTVDAHGCNIQSIRAAGVDDVFLRTVVMMLAPQLFLDPQAVSRPVRTVDIDQLLERIEAELTARVTLSDMERWSDLSARTIQAAFQKRFGIGPMQWVRDRRLDLVRAKLLSAPRDATVREIAASCGITRMATLIPEYAKRFGELPSETLRRHGR